MFKYFSTLESKEYVGICDLDMICINQLPQSLENCINDKIPCFYDITDQVINAYGANTISPFKEVDKSDTQLSVYAATKKATENIFQKKNIPFRSFEIKKRDEKTLGELFCFFVLETILLSKSLKLDPYDQPAVELIKNETKKLLI